ANDLTNQAFTFTNGAGANLATVIGLPQGQAFTLQFGNFGGTNVGPVTLDSGGSTASGTVTLGSCTFRYDRSTFPAGRRPHSDARARFFSGRVYVVNRLRVDSIQILDPQLGFVTPTNGVLSVGNGTNPQDIAFVNATKAYVSRLGSPKLLIIDPSTLKSTGEL